MVRSKMKKGFEIMPPFPKHLRSFWNYLIFIRKSMAEEFYDGRFISKMINDPVMLRLILEALIVDDLHKKNKTLNLAEVMNDVEKNPEKVIKEADEEAKHLLRLLKATRWLLLRILFGKDTLNLFLDPDPLNSQADAVAKHLIRLLKAKIAIEVYLLF